MTIRDNRSATTPPAAAPPSYVRRHPILAAFGVLSGLSLFSALWPVSAVVIAVAVAGHATGLDRAAVLLVERLAVRIGASAHRHAHPEPSPTPAPAAPQPVAPQPAAPAPGPRHEAHLPAAPAARSRRGPRPKPHVPGAHRPVRSRRPVTADRQVGLGVDGPGL